MTQQITNVQAIKEFFEMNAKQAMNEIKALTTEERAELGALCAKALGKEIEPSR